MSQKLTPVIAVTALIVAIMTATFTVSAAPREAFLTKGNVRIALASSTTATSTTSTTYVDLISKSFTIASGKNGDVMILFCGEAASDDNMDLSASITETGSFWATNPSEMRVRTGDKSEARCANFYATNVPDGSWDANLRWKGGGGTQSMGNRSLIVIVNVH